MPKIVKAALKAKATKIGFEAKFSVSSDVKALYKSVIIIIIIIIIIKFFALGSKDPKG